MDKILNILGLKKSMKIKLDVGREEFIKLMEKKIKPNRLIFFDIFDSNQKKFYGTINESEFKLRRSQGFIPNGAFSRVHGKIYETQNKTELEISLLGWNWFILLWAFWMLMIFGFALNDILASKSYDVLILLIPSFLFFSICPFIMMRIGLKRTEKYLRAELAKMNE